MSKVHYYIDKDKIEQFEQKGFVVRVVEPRIKTTGVFGDAGIDLYAAFHFNVPPRSLYVVETFIGFDFEQGVAGLLWPRGGDDFLLGAGVIDTGYTGTVKCKIINPYDYTLTFMSGSSVGQLVLFRKAYGESPDLEEVHKSVITEDQGRNNDGRILHQVNV